MTDRRPASHLEAKALSHPLRVRLLSMLAAEEVATSELARRTGVNPGTVLHHLRVLANAGLVEAGAVRSGARNSRETPYRSTGRSAGVSFRGEADAGASVSEAIMQGALAAYYAAEPAERFGESVAIIRLSPVRVDEFQRALRDLVARFQDGEGPPVEMLVAFHRAASGS